MIKFLLLCALLIVGGCQQDVAVPTVKELIANRPLFNEWQAKCEAGEYNHLSAERKARYCSTTQEASISIAEADAAKSARDFYSTNTLRR